MNGLRTTMAHKVFAFSKPMLSASLARIVRRVFTAILQPFYVTFESGFFRSALLSQAVNKKGEPLPWYTYPAISFLSSRQFTDKTILEFGAGQSTLWWASRARSVTVFEENKDWYEKLLRKKPHNVDLIYLPLLTQECFTAQVVKTLKVESVQWFDVIVIDGGFRAEAAMLALNYLSPGGALIVDDADGYDMYEYYRDKGLKRIDFFGPQPGVLLPHVTAVFYQNDCFLLDAKQKMPTDFV